LYCVVVLTSATSLLIAAPGFLGLSASCMLEIPALAPAVAGIYVLLGGNRKGNREIRETRGSGTGATDHTDRADERGQPAAKKDSRNREISGSGTATTDYVRPVAAGMFFGIALSMKLVPLILLL